MSIYNRKIEEYSSKEYNEIIDINTETIGKIKQKLLEINILESTELKTCDLVSIGKTLEYINAVIMDLHAKNMAFNTYKIKHNLKTMCQHNERTQERIYDGHTSYTEYTCKICGLKL